MSVLPVGKTLMDGRSSPCVFRSISMCEVVIYGDYEIYNAGCSVEDKRNAQACLMRWSRLCSYIAGLPYSVSSVV